MEPIVFIAVLGVAVFILTAARRVGGLGSPGTGVRRPAPLLREAVGVARDVLGGTAQAGSIGMDWLERQILQQILHPRYRSSITRQIRLAGVYVIRTSPDVYPETRRCLAHLTETINIRVADVVADGGAATGHEDRPIELRIEMDASLPEATLVVTSLEQYLLDEDADGPRPLRQTEALPGATPPRGPSVTLTRIEGSTPDAPVAIALGPQGGVLGADADGPGRIAVSTVSALHAKILPDGEGGVAVTDLGSSNHTVLNGALLEPHRSVPLPAGAVLQLGPEVRFHVGLSGARRARRTRHQPLRVERSGPGRG